MCCILSSMNNMDVKEFVNQMRQIPAEQAVDLLCALVLKQDEMIKALEAKFTAIIAEQAAEIAALKKLVYGQKSEKRKKNDDQESVDPTLPNQQNRGKALTKRNASHQTDKGLRFSAAAEKMVIEIPVPAGEDVDVIRYEIIHRLAQRPAAVIVLEYRIPIVKDRKTNQLLPNWHPNQLFEGSYADVSFIVGMMLDKCLYHLPLYRQHQRLTNSGVDLARSTFTHWFARAADLLKPIAHALRTSILTSTRLQMDETPVKASRKVKGKMKTGYFWPILGDQDEIVFEFANTRARSHIETSLAGEFKGTLLTDGYGSYQVYCASRDNITHAICWVHWRRKFKEIEKSYPGEAEIVLEQIGKLYANEKFILQADLDSNKALEYRITHSKPIVDNLFIWCEKQLQNPKLTPKSKLRAAIQYGTKRETELRVFLEDADIPMDTNNIEREIRPIAVGKKNWMFSWTEAGAEQLGVIYSLIATCRMQGVDPYTYLVDVLLRVGQHPASKVDELIPRHWKKMFQNNPMRSDLWGKGQ